MRHALANMPILCTAQFVCSLIRPPGILSSSNAKEATQVSLGYQRPKKQKVDEAAEVEEESDNLEEEEESGNEDPPLPEPPEPGVPNADPDEPLPPPLHVLLEQDREAAARC